MGFWQSVGDFLIGPPLEQRAEVAPTQPVQGSGVLPPARDALGEVTQSRALGIEAVFRAVQLISTGVSQLTVDAYRGGAQLDDRATATWLRQPNVDESLSAFLAQTVTSLALSGNAFWRVYRSQATGDVANLRVLPANQVTVALDPSTGHRTYTYGGGRNSTLNAREVRHLQYLRLPGEARGIGPIQAAQSRLRGALGLDGYASEWLTDSGVPTGVLSTDQHLTGEQAKQWRTQWEESQRQRGTAVLGAGLNYAAIHLSPKDAQFLESQQFTTTALARLFGIPARLMLAVVEGTSQTYANLAQEDLSFVRWTLALYTREVEEAFASLLPRGQTARFNLDAILRPDTKTRYDAHKLALDAGFLTVDEVRAIEGYQPLPKERPNA